MATGTPVQPTQQGTSNPVAGVGTQLGQALTAEVDPPYVSNANQAAYTAEQVVNDSEVPGINVKEALNNLFDGIAPISPLIPTKIAAYLASNFDKTATLWTSTEVPLSSFGAVGDGVTDDTAAIQAAIDAAKAAGGGMMLVGERGATYLLSEALNFDDGRGIILGGKGSLTNGLGCPTFLWTTDLGVGNALVNMRSTLGCGLQRCILQATTHTGLGIATEHSGTGGDTTLFTAELVRFIGNAGFDIWYQSSAANSCTLRLCYFTFGRLGVAGGGNANTVELCVFSAMGDAAGDVSGEAWSVVRCVFEPTAGNLPRSFTCSASTSAFTYVGNWHGDSPNNGPWLSLFAPLGCAIGGNTFQLNVGRGSAISVRGGGGGQIAGNWFGCDSIVEFTGPETTVGFCVGPNFYEGVTATIGDNFTFGLQKILRSGLELFNVIVTSTLWGKNGGFFSGFGVIQNAAGIYVGVQTVFPAWGVPAGAAILWMIGAAGYGTGLGYLPSQNDAAAGHHFFARDAADPNGQSVYYSILAGVNRTKNPTAHTEAALVLANGTNHDVAGNLSGTYVITGPTADFTIDGISAGISGQQVLFLYFGSHQITLNPLTGSAANNQLVTHANAAVVLAPPPANGYISFTAEYVTSGGLNKWVVST